MRLGCVQWRPREEDRAGGRWCHHLSLCAMAVAFSCSFFFFSSVLLVSHVVVVHQRSFYSGVEDDRHKVLLVVLVQPGYYYITGAKQVHLPAAAALDTCLCFNYKCLCD